MRFKSYRLLLAIVLVLLFSCKGNVIYHHYEHVEDNAWSQSDTLNYLLPPVPHKGTYALEMGLRYGSDFPYRDITVVADFGMGVSDTLTIPFATNDGKPLGHGVGLLHKTIPLSNLQLNEGQQVTISIHHIMRREILPSIFEVGLKLSAQRQ